MRMLERMSMERAVRHTSGFGGLVRLRFAWAHRDQTFMSCGELCIVRRMNRYLAVALLLAACGDDNGGAPIDAPPVVIDAPPPPPGHHHYVIDSLLVPTNNTMARDYGFDLNNDGAIDNQLGMVLGTLASMGLDVQLMTTQNGT